LAVLWALEWAWHVCVTNERCVQAYNLKSQLSIFSSFRYIRAHIYDV